MERVLKSSLDEKMLLGSTFGGWRRETTNLICKSTSRGWRSPFLDFARIFLQRKWKSDYAVVSSDPSIAVYLVLRDWSSVISSRIETCYCYSLYFSVHTENTEWETNDCGYALVSGASYGCGQQKPKDVLNAIYLALGLRHTTYSIVQIFFFLFIVT